MAEPKFYRDFEDEISPELRVPEYYNKIDAWKVKNAIEDAWIFAIDLGRDEMKLAAFLYSVF